MDTRRLRFGSPPLGVLYVTNSSVLGGGNRVLMSMLGNLDRARFRPCLIAPGDNPLLAWAKPRGIRCWAMTGSDWQGRRGLVSGAPRLAKVMLATRAAIVHAMAPLCYRAAGLAGALTGAARVCHLGAASTPDELAWSFRFGPDAVIACSERQACDVRVGLRRTKLGCRVVAIPNGIDPTAFIPSAGAPSATERAWRFGAEHVVVTVARLSEVKDFPTLLAAAAGVVSELDNCAFVIVGDEETVGYRASLERLVDQLGLRGQVHFLGWRTDVAELLRAADVAALASRSEGLPLSVLEAMACARPVVATSVGGVPEAVLDGTTGLLVPPRDPDALAAAILRLLKDPGLARRMGQAGRRHVEAHFSLERALAQVQALYDELSPPPAG